MNCAAYWAEVAGAGHPLAELWQLPEGPGGFGIAGLGGAWFSMEGQGGFQDNMTNGAGFIALAALIFGRWRPWSAFAGAMLFGFTRALGTRLQILDVTIGDFSIPSEFWQALPYVVTIIVVAGAVGRSVAPAA